MREEGKTKGERKRRERTGRDVRFLSEPTWQPYTLWNRQLVVFVTGRVWVNCGRKATDPSDYQRAQIHSRLVFGSCRITINIMACVPMYQVASVVIPQNCEHDCDVDVLLGCIRSLRQWRAVLSTFTNIDRANRVFENRRRPLPPLTDMHTEQNEIRFENWVVVVHRPLALFLGP